MNEVMTWLRSDLRTFAQIVETQGHDPREFYVLVKREADIMAQQYEESILTEKGGKRR